jgi:hypothetical protein
MAVHLKHVISYLNRISFLPLLAVQERECGKFRRTFSLLVAAGKPARCEPPPGTQCVKAPSWFPRELVLSALPLLFFLLRGVLFRHHRAVRLVLLEQFN